MSELPKIAVVVSVASFLAVSPSALHAQSECNARQILQPGNCIGDDLDALEIELAKQINDYRLRNGLPAIPLSPALSLIAKRIASIPGGHLGSHGKKEETARITM